MTNPHTPEKVAELIAVAETWAPNECAASPVGAWNIIERLADALTAVSAERDTEHKRAEGFRQAFLNTSKDRFRIKVERDRLHKAITEALEPKNISYGYADIALERVERILRAALDKEGNDDEQDG